MVQPEYPENVSKTLSLLKHLQEAIRNGYEFSVKRIGRKQKVYLSDFAYQVSPVVDTLIDSIVDQLFLLGDLFQQGAPDSYKNPALIFKEDQEDLHAGQSRPVRIAIDEYEHQGAKAGVQGHKSIRIPVPKHYYWDPKAPTYFRAMIEFFIRIRKHDDIKGSFMKLFEYLGFSSKVSKNTLKFRQKASYFWWRRQQRR